jgi:hypothetical protein
VQATTCACEAPTPHDGRTTPHDGRTTEARWSGAADLGAELGAIDHDAELARPPHQLHVSYICYQLVQPRRQDLRRPDVVPRRHSSRRRARDPFYEIFPEEA